MRQRRTHLRRNCRAATRLVAAFCPYNCDETRREVGHVGRTWQIDRKRQRVRPVSVPTSSSLTLGNDRMVTPRIIRFRDAPAYLGMDRNRFNAEVRPNLTEIPIG